MEALTTTITAAVTSAVQAAMKSPTLPSQTAATASPVSVEEMLSGHLESLTSPTAGTTEPSPSGAGTIPTGTKILAVGIDPYSKFHLIM